MAVMESDTIQPALLLARGQIKAVAAATQIKVLNSKCLFPSIPEATGLQTYSSFLFDFW